MPDDPQGDNQGKKFTPYTVNEYKTLSRTHNTKLGGLGANFDSEWEKKQKKTEKAKEFSKVIRGLNQDKISRQVVKPKAPPEAQKQPTLKEKAIEFAKSVPKPKPKKQQTLVSPDPAQATPNGKPQKQEAREVDDEINKMEDDLEALERQHLYYQDKINKLKS